MTGSSAMQNELVTLQRRDHQKAEQLLERFAGLPSGGRADAFSELTRELLRHELAQTVVVDPALREYVDLGDAVADRRISTQSDVEDYLAELEDLEITGDNFGQRFTRLREVVLARADLEEADVLHLLTSRIPPDELRQIGRQYEKARASAYAHPHHRPVPPPRRPSERPDPGPGRSPDRPHRATRSPRLIGRGDGRETMSRTTAPASAGSRSIGVRIAYPGPAGGTTNLTASRRRGRPQMSRGV